MRNLAYRNFTIHHGKTTLFYTPLQGCNPGTLAPGRTNLDKIEVPDPSLDQIAQVAQPSEITSTTAEVDKIPGLTKGGSKIKEGKKFLTNSFHVRFNN